MQSEHFVGFREAGKSPRLGLVALFIAIISALILICSYSDQASVKETYTERTYRVERGTVIETEFIRECNYRMNADDLAAMRIVEDAVIAGEAKADPIEMEATVETAVLKHFPESTYIKGAILLTGEAVGVPSLTRQSGCLWIVCNRVLSPKFPNDIEAVIEQSSQFDGYTAGGSYTEECYNLAVDVFERFYRECNGEDSISVGRSIPADYLYFTGDGQENHFRKTQTGPEYVWGSQFVSPYKN